jgi:hypothetical protein
MVTSDWSDFLAVDWLTMEHISILEDNQRGNQNPYIEEEQITQWSKEKVQRTNNDLQTYT